MYGNTRRYTTPKRYTAFNAPGSRLSGPGLSKRLAKMPLPPSEERKTVTAFVLQ